MPVGQEHHSGVPVAMPVAPGGIDQPLDLGFGEMFAGAQVGIRPPARHNCSIYGSWRDQLEMRFRHRFPPIATVRKMAVLRTIFNAGSFGRAARRSMGNKKADNLDRPAHELRNIP